MKIGLSILALFLGAASAEAAMNCKTYWGNNASVSVHGDKLGIQFQGGRYPSSVMRANGASESSFYFRRNNGGGEGFLAIVQKQVLNGEKGKIKYYFPRNNNKGQDSISLYCN
jgi:hypothetical protein